MRGLIFTIGTLAIAVALVGGCQNETPIVGPDIQDNPLSIGAATTQVDPRSQGGPRPRPQTWVDGELFDGVVTPANFNPESDPFDELYTCGGAQGQGFRDGVPLISDSKPGDQDYNGGRWHQNVAKVLADCLSDYSDATSVEDLDLDDFDLTSSIYFECPLLPRRGNRP